MAAAIASVDIALWDLRGRVLGKPVHGQRIAALAESLDKPIVEHNTQRTLRTAASPHYVASCSTAFPQEWTGLWDNLWKLFRTHP